MALLLLILVAAGAGSAMASSSKTIRNNSAGCPSYGCGPGVDIRYPFWTDAGDDTNSRCGYPSLRLHCSGGNSNTPLLRLPSGDYAVSRITYGDTAEGDRTVWVFNPTVSNVSCPVAAACNVTLPPGSPPPLYLTLRDTKLTLYINCSFLSFPSHLLTCMEGGNADGLQKHHTYIFRESDSGMPDKYALMCQQVVAMPVLQRAVINSTAPLDAVAPGMSMGFELGWRQAMGGECGVCEKAGGLCGQRREALGGDWGFTCLSRNAMEPAMEPATEPVRPHAADASSLCFKRVLYAAVLLFLL